MEWKHGEKGPTCFCGNHTSVMVANGEVNLLCFAHTRGAGAVFPLPKNGRPDNWPNVSDEEMMVLVDKGFDEQGIQEGAQCEVDITKVAN